MKPIDPRGAITIAVLLGLSGWYLGYKFEPHWFGRFGALVVLFGVAAEYSLVQSEMANIYQVVKERSGVWNDDHWGLEISNRQKRLSLLAHIVVVSGTLIWGFGDLVLT